MQCSYLGSSWNTNMFHVICSYVENGLRVNFILKNKTSLLLCSPTNSYTKVPRWFLFSDFHAQIDMVKKSPVDIFIFSPTNSYTKVPHWLSDLNCCHANYGLSVCVQVCQHPQRTGETHWTRYRYNIIADRRSDSNHIKKLILLIGACTGRHLTTENQLFSTHVLRHRFVAEIVTINHKPRFISMCLVGMHCVARLPPGVGPWTPDLEGQVLETTDTTGNQHRQRTWGTPWTRYRYNIADRGSDSNHIKKLTGQCMHW